MTLNYYTLIDGLGSLLEASENGFIYEGMFKSDEWTKTWKKGDVLNMRAEGFGRQINHDQNWYQGYFKDGLFEGEGTYWDNELGRIDGIWEKGKIKTYTGDDQKTYAKWKAVTFMQIKYKGPMKSYY